MYKASASRPVMEALAQALETPEGQHEMHANHFSAGRPSCGRGQQTLSTGLIGCTAAFAPMSAVPMPQRPAWAQASIQDSIVTSPQRTSEVSTEELRRIIGSGGAILLDARPFM